MKDWQFTKEHTNAAKGVAIIGILFHHLFMGVSADWSLPFDAIGVQEVALFLKVCVAIFVFLSAYGLTKVWNGMARSGEVPLSKRCTLWITTRYIKLMSGFWFVYVLAVIITSFTSRTPASIYGQEPMPFLSAVMDFLGLANFFGSTLLNETWWYMSLAIVVMICIPFLVIGEQKLGLILVFFLMMVPNYVLQTYGVAADYILPAVLGVYFAQHQVFERVHLKKITNLSILDAFLKIILAGWLLLVLYQIRMRYGRVFLVDGFSATLMIFLTTEFLTFRPLFWLRAALAFVGKHSMNIFLVHTFIFSFYFTDFIYSFRTPVAITCALLATSLLLSLAIEGLKKLLRYDPLMDQLRKKIQQHLEKA